MPSHLPVVMTAIVRDHCLAPERVDAPVYGGRYRSLFEDLPPLRSTRHALHALGRPGGPCDLGADAAGDADSRVAAVWPFFGQFVAHDITADRSPLVASRRPGPDPQLPHPAGEPRGRLRRRPGRLAVPVRAATTPPSCCSRPAGGDVPRNHEGIALIGDPRNDVHLFTSQMLVAFIELHNRLVDRLRDDGVAEPEVFEEARRAATWHYQHVILREFLPGLIGARADRRAARRRRRSCTASTDDPYIPFEFADAAYRYGHAQIRDRYQVNAHFGPCPVFPDLMGFGPVPPEHTVDWALQIDVAGHAAGAARQAHRRAAARVADRAARPRSPGRAPGTDYASLANRDLQRGHAVGLAVGRGRRARASACPR